MRSLRKPYRIRKKKSVLRSRFFWLFVLFLTIGGGIFYTILFAPFFQVKQIKIVGVQKLPPEEIQNLIEENIERKFLFFSSKSIFLASKKEIVSKLSKRFPWIDEFNFKKKLPDVLILEIKEREGIGCFCRQSVCFLIDQKRIIFEETTEPCSLNLLIRDLRENVQYNLGEQAIEEEPFEVIQKIRNKIKDFQINIAEFNISEISENKITAKTPGGWEIYFNLTVDIDWQLTKLKLVLEKEIPPEKREGLEYIDLRFGNFATYKYRD